ncbi:hypothetical protein PTKIN_Ptkin17bG0024600 [Pterospermum kingtungense]
MTRIVNRRVECSKWHEKYGLLIKKRFYEIKKEAVAWIVHWNGECGCEVKKGKKQCTVRLKKKSCNCRGWQLSGIPCAHAVYAIWHDGGDPDDYSHNYYSPQTFMKSYQYALQPINGLHECKKKGLEPILPLIIRKTPGKLRKNRRKLKNEPKKTIGKLVR